ncbi:MAG: dCMP deaminase family protein [Spirochaetaceae bacterium]
MKKRESYISWDEYFMGIAILSGKRSKDPNTQVGACIVKDNKILGIGYNGLPKGCSDDDYPWSKTGEFMDTKYPYIVHAELNAILNSNNSDISDAELYVGLFPCNECAKAIIQSGITKVIYLSDKYKDQDVFKVSRRLFDSSGVKYIQLDTNKDIHISLDPKLV